MTSQSGTPGAQAHERFLTTKEAARLLGDLSHRTLEEWRLKGFGPPFIKAGRRVLYKLSALMAWLDAQTFRNTGEAGA
jgi:excisionase family DNA binding protein